MQTSTDNAIFQYDSIPSIMKVGLVLLYVVCIVARHVSGRLLETFEIRPLVISF